MKTLLLAGYSDIARRTARLLAALAKARILPARLAYVSTSGVYDDCGGAGVDESRAGPPPRRIARAEAAA